MEVYPAAPGAPEAVTNAAPGVATPSAGTPRLGTPTRPARILIADDEEDLRKSIAIRLRKRRMEVAEAACGRDAIAGSVSAPPNVLLLDLRMPDMEGFRVIEILKMMPWLAPMPVIMMTSAHHATKVRKAVESGASDFIAKPFPWPLLIERVDQRSQSWEPDPGIPLTWANGRTGAAWVVGPTPVLDTRTAARFAELVRALMTLKDEQVQVNLAGSSLTEAGLSLLLREIPRSGGWSFIGSDAAAGEPSALKLLGQHVPLGSGTRLTLKTYLHGRVGVLEVRGSCLHKEALISEKIQSLAITRTLVLMDLSYAVFPATFLDTLTDLTKDLWNKKVALNFVIPSETIRHELDDRLGEWALVYTELGDALDDLQ